MNPIKFGTDGWRAIIADDFTVENVKRVSTATLQWMKNEQKDKPVVIGYDCRFGGKLFAETAARVMAAGGVKVLISPGFVSTPMISLAAKQLQAGCGIIITASHNPPAYNGFKLKGGYGGPALPEVIDQVENLIPAEYIGELPEFETLETAGKIEYFDMEQFYYDHAERSFDMKAIRESGLNIAYDAMFGAGQKIVKRLLPKAITLHAEPNPGFNGQAPEPIMKNLKPFVHLISELGDVDFAFATDGDADRIGVFDRTGNFIDSHHIILMLTQYLHKYKGMTGDIVNSFSCTSRISKMTEEYGLKNQVTKIGFKYICGHMITDDVLVGGEESGGIAVKNHIPERDGVWIALTLIEFMVKSGKTMEDLIEEIYAITGPFALERYDLHISEKEKERIISALKKGQYKEFGPYKVEKTEDLDGYKFHLGGGRWVMVRPSGTEPVLRVYAEAGDYEEAVKILDAAKETLLEKHLTV
jgi:phosphomannomutase